MPLAKTSPFLASSCSRFRPNRARGAWNWPQMPRRARAATKDGSEQGGRVWKSNVFFLGVRSRLSRRFFFFFSSRRAHFHVCLSLNLFLIPTSAATDVEIKDSTPPVEYFETFGSLEKKVAR